MTPPPDVLRLLAVPVFVWVAWRDHRTRRVPAWAWYPPAALGAGALVWDAGRVLGGPTIDAQLFALRVGLSLGLLVPLGYLFWRIGGFGAADAKAFVIVALVFPTAPAYSIAGVVFPIDQPAVAVFSLSAITNGVLLGVFYPVSLAVRNALAGRFAPVMIVGRPIRWTAVPTTHGKLLETTDGVTLSGLDLDALRMYLRWRGIELAALRADPDRLRDPATLPAAPNPPTDGAVDPDERLVAADPLRTDGGSAADPWGAAAFLDAVGGAYGTSPETLRAGLDVLATRDAVWVSPGIPFLVPLFAGLVVALTYGDLLSGLLRLAGLN